jgi:hypothetical protein
MLNKSNLSDVLIGLACFGASAVKPQQDGQHHWVGLILLQMKVPNCLDGQGKNYFKKGAAVSPLT